MRHISVGALLVACGSRSYLDVANAQGSLNGQGGSSNYAGGTFGSGGQACANCAGGGSGLVGGSQSTGAGGSVNNGTSGSLTFSGGSSSADVTSCTQSGKIYAIGESVPNSDGCNTCTCAPTGQIQCTLLACAGTPCRGLPIQTDADASADCGAIGMEPEPPPMDILLLVVRSSTMTSSIESSGLDRWGVVEQGVKQFLANLATAIDSGSIAQALEPEVALTFFGATGNPDDPTECDFTTYAKPNVDYAPVTSAASSLIQAIARQRAYLGGLSPWLPPLRGALMLAQQRQVAYPDRKSTVVFITDGYPNECDRSMNNIQELVAEYRAGVIGLYNTAMFPRVLTHFVGIGMGTDSIYNMNSVAQVSGTDHAVMIDGANAVADLANLLTSLTNGEASEWPCSVPLPQLPANTSFPLDQFKVIYTPYLGDAQQIPNVDGPSDCGVENGGYYFDDSNDPQEITFCPCSCANLSGGAMKFLFEGCKGGLVVG